MKIDPGKVLFDLSEGHELSNEDAHELAYRIIDLERALTAKDAEIDKWRNKYFCQARFVGELKDEIERLRETINNLGWVLENKGQIVEQDWKEVAAAAADKE